jgi:hypothetical protein
LFDEDDKAKSAGGGNKSSTNTHIIQNSEKTRKYCLRHIHITFAITITHWGWGY